MQSDAITHAAAQKAAYEAQLAAAAEESYKQHCLRQSAAAAAMRESDEDAAVKLSKAAKMLGADPASLQSQLAAERAACAQLDESFRREQEQREANMRKFAKVMKLLGDKEAEGLLMHGGGSGDYYLEQRGLDESGSGSRRNSLTNVMKGLQEMKRGISGRVTRSMSNSPPVRRGSRHLKSTGSSSSLTGTLQGVFSRSDSTSTADMQNFINTAGNDDSSDEEDNNSSSNNSSSGSSSSSKKKFSSSGRGRQRGSGNAATGGSSTGWQLASPESTKSSSAILSSAGSSCIRIDDVSPPLRAERSIADMAAEALQAVRDEDEAAMFANKTSTATATATDSAASGSSSSGEVTAAAAPTRQRHVRTSGARQHRVVEDLFGDMMLHQHSSSPKHKRNFTHNSTSSSSSSVATVTAAEECYAPRSSSGAAVSGGSGSSAVTISSGAPPRMPAVPRRSSKSTSPGLSPMSPLVTGSSGIPNASGIASGHRSRSNSTTAAAAAAAIAAAAGAAAAAAEIDAQLRSVAVAALESVELDTAAPLVTAAVAVCSSSSSSVIAQNTVGEIVGKRQGHSQGEAAKATAAVTAVTADEGNSGAAADAVIVSVD
jgi:hypothetical protein